MHTSRSPDFSRSSTASKTLSSPQRIISSPENHAGQKERRQPSITPRKFKQFFTPRSYRSLPSTSSARVLSDITHLVNDRNGVQALRTPGGRASCEESSPFITREMKRRKVFHSPMSSPELVVKQCVSEGMHFSPSLDPDASSDLEISTPPSIASLAPCSDQRITKLCHARPKMKYTQYAEARVQGIHSPKDRGIARQLLQLSIDPRVPPRSQAIVAELDWRVETSAFYTKAADTHLCNCLDLPEQCIPFCAIGCNTNTLVVVGDEEGRVRFLESAENGKPSFKDSYLTFRPHSNAVIDMALTEDDLLLATASGDQTARIVDTRTQTTTYILAQHSASLKQVQFQPGSANNSVLATSSRDGTVRVWDLRCKGGYGPMQSIHVSFDPSQQENTSSRANQVKYGCAVNSIHHAHRDELSKNMPGRAGDVSVTAISFLPQGREHLLVTGSEVNASVKLWDLRALNNGRRRAAAPLSSTSRPQTHSQWRHFGLSSISLSDDGSRMYTLCRDNSIYAYSVNHLILGRAPEYSFDTPLRRRQPTDVQESLGPLYGLRHSKLHVTSFYIKCALRTPRDGKSEMLAVGSSDCCAVLFPTDERHHRPQYRPPGTEWDTASQQKGSNTLLDYKDESIHISQNGTPLIRGHEREVGSVTWTSDGELITVGDDFMVRCWREGHEAQDLRTGGEQGGRRWGSGWADIVESYDEGEV